METLMPALNETSKALYLGEVMADLLVFAFALAQWSRSGAAIFVTLLGLSMATGTMKIVLPGVQRLKVPCLCDDFQNSDSAPLGS